MLLKHAFPTLLAINLLGLPPTLLAAVLSYSSLASRAPISAPAPLVIPPSGRWDGIDGPWSSFDLSVGGPAQTVRVLISTSSNQPWVVVPDGCSSSARADCASSRGDIYSPGASSYKPTWINNQTSGIYAATIGAGYGLNVNIAYGYDTVRLGSAENDLPSLPDQLVGGLTTNDFYMGMFGLSSLSTKFEGLGAPVESLISRLKSSKYIPSLSYGYTAGNMYAVADTKGYGSLILGGHDTSLYTQNDLTFKFNNSTMSNLRLFIASIAVNNDPTSKTSTILSPNALEAVIDTSVPYIYLPTDICKQFEAAFGLVWDEKSQLYLVDDKLRAKLLAQNANVTFALGNSSSTTLTNIVLPYKAFDLMAQSPLVQTGSHYFPLKRASNPAQVTLGRAFLQEAYLIVDYERAYFSLHQRVWPTGAPPKANVVAITPLSRAETTTKKKEAGPNVTAIVLGVIGGLVLLAVIAGATLLAIKRQKRINAEQADAKESSSGSSTPDQSENPNPPEFSIHSNEMVMPYQTTHRSLDPHTNSIYGNVEVRPSSMWDLNSGPLTGPRPTSSIYESDGIDHTRQTVVGGLAPPNNFRQSEMRFSAAEWTSTYEPTIMEKRSSDLGTQSRYFQNGDMPTPLEIRKSMAVDRGGDPFEDVHLETPKKSTEFFTQPKKSFWI